MSDTDLAISSLMTALKATITKNETEIDAVITKLEEVKRQLAESDIELSLSSIWLVALLPAAPLNVQMLLARRAKTQGPASSCMNATGRNPM